MNDRHSDFYRDTEFGLQTCSGFAGSTSKIKRSTRQEMANRKGVFIGAYVPNHLKESLRRRAAAEHRTLSQEITRILEEAVHGRGLPAGSIDRRTKDSQPRRRATDPMPRRRTADEPYGSDGNRAGDDRG